MDTFDRDMLPHRNPEDPSSSLLPPPSPTRPFTDHGVALSEDNLCLILDNNCDALAQMMQAFVTVNAANTLCPAPTTAPAVPRPPKLNLKAPEEFNGQSKNIVNFLSDISVHILTDPITYQSDLACVMFFLSFCSKGSTRTWKNKMLADIESGQYQVTSYRDFTDLFKWVFYNVHAEEEAQH